MIYDLTADATLTLLAVRFSITNLRIFRQYPESKFVILKSFVLLIGLKFFETSAKDNVNVKAVFDLMVDMILEKMAESSDHDGAMAGSGAPGGEYWTSFSPFPN